MLCFIIYYLDFVFTALDAVFSLVFIVRMWACSFNLTSGKRRANHLDSIFAKFSTFSLSRNKYKTMIYQLLNPSVTFSSSYFYSSST